MTTPRTPADRLDIREATVCHCTLGKAAVNGSRCDCIEARVHAAELQTTFDLRWKADMRAIKAWQAAHPGNDLVWPDHADMVVWLLDFVDAAGIALPASESTDD